MGGAFRQVLMALAVVFAWPGPGAAQDAPSWGVVNVGVLAHRGTGDLEANWAPLRDHLDAAVPGSRFQFIPVTLVSAQGQLENRNLDFLITNPGHYVTLERDFPMSVLATRVRHAPSGEITRAFGSVVFTAATSDIAALRDIAGRSVLAVDAAAFGGFQVAWHEFAHQGIDLFRDPASLSFSGFPQDQIVTRVLAGEVDVGIVRSGLLEAMAREGRIRLDDVRVLNPNADYAHPVRLSTRLYPEWPFLALAGTDATMRNAVARALLDTSAPEARARLGLADSWEAPVSYHAVRDLLAAYGEAAQAEAAGPWLRWVALAALVLAPVGAALLWLRRRRVAPAAPAAPPSVTAAAAEPEASHPPLTRREAEILAQICDGNSTKEIAKALGISPKTVEFHRSNLLRKFGAHSSLQLVKLASGQPTQGFP